MKKRLRKKKHVGEFTEWGRELILEMNPATALDEFMDSFIADAIEANGCYCGGGGDANHLEFVVELGRFAGHPDERMNRIKNWLDARQDVQGYKVGDLFDLWYGES
jgi:uncharacterized protein YggL (DUF469 family)